MSGERVVAIAENGGPDSVRIAKALAGKLAARGFSLAIVRLDGDAASSGAFPDKHMPPGTHPGREAACGNGADAAMRKAVDGAELIVCVGGDGSFLHALRRFGMPETPFVGVNTGHLGFFQELDEERLDVFLDRYESGDFVRQVYRTVEGQVRHAGGTDALRGLNEIVVRGVDSRLCHLDIYIGDSFIEDFSGDGIVVSTPAGSTAYNYALGGGIVDPRLALLQVTPIAPINNSAYRSFTSSILLPPDLEVGIIPKGRSAAHETIIATDGAELRLSGVERVSASLSERRVTLLRFKDYYFWNTAKRKLL